MDLVAGFFAAVTFLAGLRFKLVALPVAGLTIVCSPSCIKVPCNHQELFTVGQEQFACFGTMRDNYTSDARNV